VLLLGSCISARTVRAKPDIIILLGEQDTQWAAYEIARMLCYQRYGVLCWKSARALDKCVIAFIISYLSMERPMDQQQVMRITKALADPTRFRILQVIAAAGESCCSELATRFPVTQATCSQHLKVLTDAGLLTMRREGQFNYYRFVRDTLETYRSTLGTSFEGVPSLA
jgi:ArsR family transcriptional regulator, arsenate/arsenite/antimonite-responsive transcriptional repressor